MKRRIFAGILALCLIFGLAACAKKNTVDSRTVTLTVVHGDGSTKDFTVESDQEFLGDALQKEGIISGEESQYGLFVKTVDGETVDEGAQQWWCLTKGGETVNTGVDSTPFAEGDVFEFTLTVGY